MGRNRPISEITVGENKFVRCLHDWLPSQEDDNRTYTKCIRVGTQWNRTNRWANFFIGNPDGSDRSDEPEVVVYFSDNATYFGDSLNRDGHTVACLSGNVSADCDWEKIFSDPLTVNGSTSSVTVVEWLFPYSPDGEPWGIWFEFDTVLQMGTYSVDYSFGNQVYSANLDQMVTRYPLPVDPRWMLAAWSVNINGTVNATRFPAMMLHDFGPDPDNWTDEAWFEYLALNIFAMAQAMSLVSYQVSTNENAAGEVLDRWVMRRVWAYGLGSRTSILGVVVVCAGMVTVVFRCMFAEFCRVDN